MFDPNLMVQQGPGPGERFAQAFQQGQQTNQQNMAKAAMAALVKDPNNEKALEALASVDPQSAMQFKQQRLEQAKMQLGAHYDAVMKGAEIIREVKPTDDASWQQVLQRANMVGIPLNEVPQHYDQQYVSNVIGLADTFKRHTEPQDRIITPQPGGGAWTLAPDGSMKQLIAPNPGDKPAGAPVANEPPAQAVERLRANPHEAAQFDEIFGPGASQQILGGQTAPAPSATFPGSY